MTNGKQSCGCTWDNGEVVEECREHFEFFKKQMIELIEMKHELERIKVYAKNEHPMLSSRPCPLCEWDSTVEKGIWKGQNRKPCSYHFALDQLYKLKVVGREDIWNDES
jgi:hypothetical protein